MIDWIYSVFCLLFECWKIRTNLWTDTFTSCFFLLHFFFINLPLFSHRSELNFYFIYFLPFTFVPKSLLLSSVFFLYLLVFFSIFCSIYRFLFFVSLTLYFLLNTHQYYSQNCTPSLATACTPQKLYKRYTLPLYLSPVFSSILYPSSLILRFQFASKLSDYFV